MQILPCTLPHGFVRRCARPNKLLSLDPPPFHSTVIVAVTLLVEVEPAAPQRTNKLCSRNTQRLGNSCGTKQMRVLARFSSPSFAPFRMSLCLALRFNPVSFFFVAFYRCNGSTLTRVRATWANARWKTRTYIHREGTTILGDVRDKRTSYLIRWLAEYK